MKPALKCPSCNNTHFPKPEDFSSPLPNSEREDTYDERIFLRRYGQDADGYNIECLICTSCNRIINRSICIGSSH